MTSPYAGWIPFTEKLYYCSTEKKLKMRPVALARRLIAAVWRHSNLMSGMSYAHRGRHSARGRGGVLLRSVLIFSRPAPTARPGLAVGVRAEKRFEPLSVLKLVHHADAASRI